MKKLFIVLFAASFITTASAQENKNEERRQMPNFDRTEMMVKELGLNAEQTEKVKALNEEYKDLFRMGGRRGFGNRPGMGRRPNSDGNTETTPRGNRPERTDKNQERTERPRFDRAEMENRMKERKEKMDEYDSKLKKILNKDQFTKYESDREKRMQNRGNFGRQRN